MREGSWQPGDIDVYTTETAFDAFVSVFQEKMHAEEVKIEKAREHDTLSYTFGIVSIRRFRSATTTYDIINTECDLHYTLAGFHSTVVMNVLTHDHIYISHPRRTLKKTGIRTNNPWTQRMADVMAKYAGRGFTITPLAYGETIGLPIGELRIGLDGTMREAVPEDSIYCMST